MQIIHPKIERRNLIPGLLLNETHLDDSPPAVPVYVPSARGNAKPQRLPNTRSVWTTY